MFKLDDNMKSTAIWKRMKIFGNNRIKDGPN